MHSLGRGNKRNRLLFIAAIGVATLAVPPSNKPVLIYNASASLPIGFYAARPVNRLARGDLVLVQLPKSIQDFAAARHYLPAHVPLIKRIAALAGDQVCVESDLVLVNGEARAQLLKQDHSGRALVPWNECRRLKDQEVFLLAPIIDSFDSRYFGPIARSAVQAKLVPLWVW